MSSASATPASTRSPAEIVRGLRVVKPLRTACGGDEGERVMSERDLPEGVIDADPPGGWESADTADAETDEQNRDAAGSSDLADDPDAVQSSLPGQGADPDLSPTEES
jgi:hypothetical protein